MSAGYSAGYLRAASGWTPACPLGPHYPAGRAVSHHISQRCVLVESLLCAGSSR